MLSAAPGVELGLDELLEMRHRLHEARLFSSQNRRSPLVGLHHSRLRGRGVDFDQVRIYQPGDDVRTIDWRVTARTREPHTKLFHEERERPVFVLVEQSQRLFFGSGLCFKAVLAARAAAFIGWSALAHNDRIGGLVFSDRDCHEIKPRRSKHSLLQLFNQLLRANRELRETPAERPGELFGLALRRAREVLRPGSLILVLCDERTLNDVAEQQLSLIARHTDLVLLPLSDPLDHALPAAGLLRFREGAADLELDTHADELRQAYRELAEARRARWQRLAQRLGVRCCRCRPRKTWWSSCGTCWNNTSRGIAHESARPAGTSDRPCPSAGGRQRPAGGCWPPCCRCSAGALATAPAPAAAHHRHPRRSAAGSAARSGPGRTGRACQALRQGFRRAWLQAINGLLKRVCRARWPDSGSHALSGRAWLAFLDNRCPAAGLTRWMILVEGGYRADCTLDDKAVDGLDAAVATWIRKHV